MLCQLTSPCQRKTSQEERAFIVNHSESLHTYRKRLLKLLQGCSKTHYDSFNCSRRVSTSKNLINLPKAPNKNQVNSTEQDGSLHIRPKKRAKCSMEIPNVPAEIYDVHVFSREHEFPVSFDVLSSDKTDNCAPAENSSFAQIEGSPPLKEDLESVNRILGMFWEHVNVDENNMDSFEFELAQYLDFRRAGIVGAFRQKSNKAKR